MPSDLWLADTNILIRWLQPEDREFPAVVHAVDTLLDKGVTLCYTMQNLAEFWNVMTRPANRNGYGFSPEEANARTHSIETRFRLLPDDANVYFAWRGVLVEHAVRGVQVHDARLVAAMQTHGVPRILTFNTRDFARYAKIEAIHPSQVSSA
jgi:predicted nucleic acid-binding protein